MMKALVESIAVALVDDPRGVSVREIRGPRESRLELSVAGGEIGRVIGREGRTARAIRTLLGVTAKKAGRRVVLEILE